MSDLISREEVLRAIITAEEVEPDLGYTNLHKVIENLPSAEMDIIRCEDCKWWDRDPESVYGYCNAIKHGYHSSNWEIGIYRKYKGDFYCADAVIE